MTIRREDDIQLAHACASGSNIAWSTLVDRHGKTVRFAAIRTLQRHCGSANDDLVEELVSQVFFKLVSDDFRRLRAYRGSAGLKSWLRVMAVNHVRDHLRRRKPRVAIEADGSLATGTELQSSAPGADVLLVHAELLTRMRALWDQLSPADSDFVQLYYVDELPFDVIAEQLQTSVGALYARKNRVQHRLRELAIADGLIGAGKHSGGAAS